MTELKPCPFCGSPGECCEGTSKYGVKTFYVGCSDEENCSTSMLFCYAENSPEWAIKEWNTRAPDEKMEKLIKFIKQDILAEIEISCFDSCLDRKALDSLRMVISNAEKLLKEIGEL